MKGVVEYIGVKQAGVTGDWRKPYNEEHQDVYYSPNVGVNISREYDGQGM
jgi:hypothetical protein